MNVRSYTKVIISFLLLSIVLSLIPQVYATTETRYFRTDFESVGSLQYHRLLTENIDEYGSESESWQSASQPSQAYLRSLIYAYHQDDTFDLIATSAGVTVSGSTVTLYSEDVNIPQTSLDPTDRIYVLIQYSTDGSTWTSLASARFITEQLGATLLNSATWTIHYYAELTSTYSPWTRRWTNTIYFYFGDSTYPSRIEGFSWSTGPTKEWHDITLWNFTVQTRQWNMVSAWSFTVLTRTWHNIATCIFNLTTMAWHNISTWIFNIVTKTWNNIAQWTWNLVTHGWHTITYWTITFTTEIQKKLPFIILIGGIFTVLIAIFMFYKR